jgi:Tol biopolymer transport system component
MDTQKRTPPLPRARSAALSWLLARLLLVLGIGLLPLSAGSSSVFAQQEAICFEETGYCISGRIREFWEQNGGLYVFGYPIGPQHEKLVEDQIVQAQEFERNRLELHPENAPPYDVLLGRLGADRLEQQGREWQEFPTTNARADCRYFPETGHNVCGTFLEAWRAAGLEIDGEPGKSEVENLALFGLPLSEAQPETLSDGRQYVVQWFERARFESHPQNNPPYHVLFGLLGNEVRAFEAGEDDADENDENDDAGEDDENGEEQEPDETATPEPEELPMQQIAFASSREGDREVFVMNADGTDVVNITDHPAIDSTPSWSPDGSKIVFASERDGNREIYVMNSDGSDQVRLTDNRADDWNPVWSPDGWRIAFETNRTGDWEIYTMSIDGTQQINISNRPGDDREPAWSPDSSQIAFTSDRDGNNEIYVMRDDGARQTNLTDSIYNDSQADWSPDGEQIVFVSNRDGDREIYVMDEDGDDVEQLTSSSARDEEPDWSPDGEYILFRSERDGNQELYIMDADGSDEENITRNRAVDRDPAWGPDPAQMADE